MFFDDDRCTHIYLANADSGQKMALSSWLFEAPIHLTTPLAPFPDR